MIETVSLSFRYRSGHDFRFPDFRLEKGGRGIISGKSGTGKTTLLHLLSGILSASSGRVLINNIDIQANDFKGIDHFRGRHIGLIFQKHFFIESLNMLDNLLIANSLPGLPPAIEFLSELMEELEVAHLSAKYPSQISQGELQRFSVARAFANKPLILLADEPTSSLDDENCNRFIGLLKSMTDKFDTTLLVATHDARLKEVMKTMVEL